MDEKTTNWVAYKSRIKEQTERIKNIIGPFSAVITGRSGEAVRYILDELRLDVVRVVSLHSSRGFYKESELVNNQAVLVDDHVDTGITTDWVYHILKGRLKGLILYEIPELEEGTFPNHDFQSYKYKIRPEIILGDGKNGLRPYLNKIASFTDLKHIQEESNKFCSKQINNLSIRFTQIKYSNAI